MKKKKKVTKLFTWKISTYNDRSKGSACTYSRLFAMDRRRIDSRILEAVRIAVERKWDGPRHIRSQRRLASDCHRPPLSRGFIDGGTDRPPRINTAQDNEPSHDLFCLRSFRYETYSCVFLEFLVVKYSSVKRTMVGRGLVNQYDAFKFLEIRKRDRLEGN